MKHLYCQWGKLCLYLFWLIIFFLLIYAWAPVQAQEITSFQGRVLSGVDDKPLPGASVRIKGTNQGTTTGQNGMFTLTTSANRVTLSFSFIGYVSTDTSITLPLTRELSITLPQDAAQLAEVSVNGYQEISSERTVGSFLKVGNDLFNRRVSTNLLDRLDGVTSGVIFKGEPTSATSSNPLGRSLGIRIRGESTLAEVTQVSRDPLIVVDNFPFDGNMDAINPNDVESITILRDAAAASIWGARAGNGVIIITTKKGALNKSMKIEAGANFTVIEKPNLAADRNYLPAVSYIEIEKALFDAGYFNSDLSNITTRPVVSPAVEILALQRAGQLTEAQTIDALTKLSQQDLRQQYLKYVYQKAIQQQYNAGLRGGTERSTYSVSLGLDRNLNELIGNSYQRFTVNSTASYLLSRKLELTTAINYANNKMVQNNYQNSFGSLSPGGKYTSLYPYAILADEQGNPLSIARDYRQSYLEQTSLLGFADWQYRPLEETALADKNIKNTSLLLKTGLKYKITSHLSAEILYQNEKQLIRGWDYRSADTYYSRNLINRFSIRNADGSFNYQIPAGGILIQDFADWNADNFRAQLHFDRTIRNDHQIRLLAGTELRQLKTESYSRTAYGYSGELGVSTNNLNFADALTVNPSGTARITAPSGEVYGFINRFVSYYANGFYSYRGRYAAYASVRRDGSNIFGANTNNRFTPLWSVGASWQIGDEQFYHSDWLPELKIRTSYGYSGNVYQGSVYTTGAYLTSSYTGAKYIHNITAPNPELRWEQIRTFNVGVEFATKNRTLSGTIEFYDKIGDDLIEQQSLAPSAGFTQFVTNGAAVRTKGIDFTLSSNVKSGNFQWQPTLLFSTLSDKITRYSVTQTSGSIQSGTGRTGIVGKPLYSIYSYKWAGLDPATGNPQGYLNGEVSGNYSGIIANFQPDSLVYHGSSVPKLFGSLRNDLSFKRFSLSINLTYKLGYYFRRQSSSPNYQDVLSGYTHQDYLDRWQQPGDEARTDVPSFVYPSNSTRSTFYRFSEVLVERADHIRLQDVRLGYQFPYNRILPSGQLFVYINNLGMVWRANSHGIDPDVVNAGNPTGHFIPRPVSYSIGLKFQL